MYKHKLILEVSFKLKGIKPKQKESKDKNYIITAGARAFQNQRPHDGMAEPHKISNMIKGQCSTLPRALQLDGAAKVSRVNASEGSGSFQAWRLSPKSNSGTDGMWHGPLSSPCPSAVTHSSLYPQQVYTFTCTSVSLVYW